MAGTAFSTHTNCGISIIHSHLHPAAENYTSASSPCSLDDTPSLLHMARLPLSLSIVLRSTLYTTKYLLLSNLVHRSFSRARMMRFSLLGNLAWKWEDLERGLGRPKSSPPPGGKVKERNILDDNWETVTTTHTQLGPFLQGMRYTKNTWELFGRDSGSQYREGLERV